MIVIKGGNRDGTVLAEVFSYASFFVSKVDKLNSMNSVLEKTNIREEIINSSGYESARLKTLQETHRLLDQSLNLEDAITRVFMLLDERHKLQSCMLSLLDEQTREVRVAVAVGVSGRGRAQGRYQLGEGITGRVVMSGRPVIVPQVSDEPLYLNRTGAIASERDERGFICVPVNAGGRTIGALGALLRQQEESDINLVADLLSVIAALIGQALRLDQASRRTEEVETSGFARSVSIPSKADLGSLVGTSSAMMTVLEQALQVAPTKTTVLIRGESGTGKELIAELIHRNSTRINSSFIKVNCAALPDSLIEAEIFGHERGAFTGAHARRKGRFEIANGGTIFLDEIGEISLATQTKLLRVLQEREFERVGGIETLSLDVRLIAATNKDLERAIADGTFREDLYYRLNVFTIFVPPLRERKPDILLLADHFVEKYAREHNKTVKRISTPAIDMLMSYHWPGNVRELENCIERAVVVCDDAVIHGHHLPPTLQTAEGSETISTSSLTSAVAALEREMIIDTLKTTRGNQARAAKLLQVSERIINYKVKKYGIDCERFRS
jgi:Nif-specific regulatory protein